jgi:GxxExxY protein
MKRILTDFLMEKTDKTNSSKLLHVDLTEKVIGIFYDVYNDLGHGFLECVYENGLSLALAQAGLTVARQKLIDVWYRGEKIGDFRADMIVNDVLLLELKSASTIDHSFDKQTLNYLKATKLEVALILNFGPTPQFRRLVFENTRKVERHHKTNL